LGCIGEQILRGRLKLSLPGRFLPGRLGILRRGLLNFVN